MRDALAANRANAISYAQDVGVKRTRRLLEAAAEDLEKRLAAMRPGTEQTFTAERARATLAQVRQVLLDLKPGMKKLLVDGAESASDRATQDTIDYLTAADEEFRGIGVQPLALDEALMFESAARGSNASILRRIASSGTSAPGAEAAEHVGKMGVLDRYGLGVIGHFEEVFRVGVVARKSFQEMQDAITAKSPFLQGAPASWAERIVRTELMGAYGRASWESAREADEQLGDMVKILSATFDDRTAADSYAVHGQIRRVEEAFATWYGLMQHPPARPNDREIVVPHRVSWPIPKYLAWRSDGEIKARWKAEGRKGSPPGRPLMTTVDLSLFGKESEEPKEKRGEGEEQETKREKAEPKEVEAETKPKARNEVDLNDLDPSERETMRGVVVSEKGPKGEWGLRRIHSATSLVKSDVTIFRRKKEETARSEAGVTKGHDALVRLINGRWTPVPLTREEVKQKLLQQKEFHATQQHYRKHKGLPLLEPYEEPKVTALVED